MLELLALLTQPFVAIGAVLGLALGVLVAAGLHWLFPYQDLLVPQAMFVGGGFIGGMFAGSLVGNDGWPRSSFRIRRLVEAQ